MTARSPAPQTTASDAPFRCAFAAQRRGDPMAGTAAPAFGFLLVEQPGPWGRFALTQSRLDPDVGSALSARAVTAGLRALLIRRPGRPAAGAGDQPRRYAVVDTRPGRESTRWGTFAADRELLEISLDVRDGQAVRNVADPFYLLCTHGRHDTCCAIWGRPVAAALATHRPDQTWECSHVGGDRFAANLLVMPHGLYYGRVDETTAHEVAEAHERGHVVARLLRGRSRWLPAAQAAQAHARELYGDTAITAFEPAGTLPLGGGRWQVRLQHDDGYLLATVTTAGGAEPGLLTCHATRPAHPPAFRVTSVVEIG